MWHDLSDKIWPLFHQETALQKQFEKFTTKDKRKMLRSYFGSDLDNIVRFDVCRDAEQFYTDLSEWTVEDNEEMMLHENSEIKSVAQIIIKQEVMFPKNLYFY